MSNDTNKPLDLDELFGQARAIKVKWGGKEYELLRISAIGPKEALTLQKMQARISVLGLQTEEITEELASELERMFDDMLTVLSKTLPLQDIPFGAKMRIIQFYTEESDGKKKTKTAPKVTGEKSSQD